jgi:hypothetical protein
MSVEQSVERVARESELLAENLSQYYRVGQTQLGSFLSLITA